ncbi:hypothetical protein NE865_00240 [Phthorimaea operculella]|nr:hypothetical protein NE865_03544 [Phthorimaea operculella]KAI5651903.1 hypothetical protein NE865_00240 [Phthorimaea operculella]
MRNSKDFQNPNVVKLLYTSLVRSKLESASVVWSPHEDTYILLLEKVQKAFLRYLYKIKYGYYPFLYPTKFILGMLEINSLEVRRNFEKLCTACQLLRGESDCPELISRECTLNVPDRYLRGRSHRLLAEESARTEAHRASPLVSARTQLNQLLSVAPDCDLFADQWTKLKVTILKYCEALDCSISSVMY